MVDRKQRSRPRPPHDRGDATQARVGTVEPETEDGTWITRITPETQIIIECLKATIRELTLLANEMQAVNDRLRAENERLRLVVGTPRGSG